MTSELTLAKSMETYLRRTYAQKEAQSKDEFPFWDYRYVIFNLICLYLMNKTNIVNLTNKLTLGVYIQWRSWTEVGIWG